MRWIIALTIVLSFTSNVFAGTFMYQQKKRGITVIFSKGANTENDDAKKYAEETIFRIQQLKINNPDRMKGYSLKNLKDINFIVTQNEAEGGTVELSELWDQYFALKSLKKENPDGSIEVPEEYRNKLRRKFALSNPPSKTDIYHQIALYKWVLEGKKIPGYDFPENIANTNALIFTHSQGNMLYEAVFTSYLADRPDLKGRYRVISVGSPVKLSYYNAYVFDKRDLLRVLDGFNWNTQNEIPLTTRKFGDGHRFIKYLNGKNYKNPKLSSSYIINNFLMNSIEELEPENNGIAAKITLGKTSVENVLLEIYGSIDDIAKFYAGSYTPIKDFMQNPKVQKNVGVLHNGISSDNYNVYLNELPEKKLVFVCGVVNLNQWSAESVRLSITTADGNQVTKVISAPKHKRTWLGRVEFIRKNDNSGYEVTSNFMN
ncbi:MAG: hypothetical protein GY793_03510 [Proteobacteria bacterium]|nr:hypothetical protein [Pseudomonadota bacterium]